ncbi:MAG: hypothetical protein HDT29_05495 [Clostridiales bacterium]|nr:hypothetical protein [Clostridiales bacterium]
MSIFLIDYENSTNLKGIGNLYSNDKVIIFYSNKANTITFDLHQEILISKAKIEYKKVAVGSPNALDFQLCSYLGYLIRENENTESNYYIIITKDKGYSSKMVSFWKGEKSIAIKIQDSIESGVQIVKTKEETVKSSDDRINNDNVVEQVDDTTSDIIKEETSEQNNKLLEEKIYTSLRNSNISLTDSEIYEIVKMVLKYKTTQTVNINMNRLLKDSAKAGCVMKVVKPFINKTINKAS